MKKDCRSNRHRDGHCFASVAEAQKPEKEVGGLSTLCAVERMSNVGMKQISAVEEIRRIKIGTQEQQHQFGQEISAKTPTKKTEKTGTKYATASKDRQTSCQPKGTVSPCENPGWHHSWCEDASDECAETFDECCGHERCRSRCPLPRDRPELRSAQRNRHGHEFHQLQGCVRDRCRSSAISFGSSKGHCQPSDGRTNVKTTSSWHQLKCQWKSFSLLQMFRDQAQLPEVEVEGARWLRITRTQSMFDL